MLCLIVLTILEDRFYGPPFRDGWNQGDSVLVAQGHKARMEQIQRSDLDLSDLSPMFNAVY